MKHFEQGEKRYIHIWNFRSRGKRDLSLPANLRTGKKGARGHRGGIWRRRIKGTLWWQQRWIQHTNQSYSAMQFTIEEKRCAWFSFQRIKYKNQIYEIEKVTVVSLSLSAHTAPSVTTTNN